MTPINGPASMNDLTAYAWALSRGAPGWFARLTEVYWDLAPHQGVRPEVAYAQACHETGFGKFGRAVTPDHHNFCGLKVTDPRYWDESQNKLVPYPDDDPRAHFAFPTDEVGVQAHLEHLRLYVGILPPLPFTTSSDLTGFKRVVSAATVDPRHFIYLRGKSGDSLEGLSGSWAYPGIGYGERIRDSILNPLLGWGR